MIDKNKESFFKMHCIILISTLIKIMNQKYTLEDGQSISIFYKTKTYENLRNVDTLYWQTPIPLILEDFEIEIFGKPGNYKYNNFLDKGLLDKRGEI